MALVVRGLAIEHLGIDVAGVERVVDDVSLRVAPGAAVAVVGESGAGKTLMARALCGLLPRAARISAGRVLLHGRRDDEGDVDVVTLDEPALRRVRGARIGFVFQEPAAALDPLTRIDDLVGAAVRAHRGASRASARAAAVALLDELGLPRRRAAAFSHELSGGERQRVAIAAALAANPDVLVADEPTSALDPTIAARIRALLQREQQRRGLGLLMVTHDLGVVAASCDDVHVMVAGRIVESGPVATVLSAPRHPYTRALLAASPARALPGTPLPVLAPPTSTSSWPSGCRFRDRCPDAVESCRDDPPVVTLADRTQVRCWRVVGASS
jgi:oligopeptide/dipeptide ABC transporter ATP-binding protein